MSDYPITFISKFYILILFMYFCILSLNRKHFAPGIIYYLSRVWYRSSWIYTMFPLPLKTSILELDTKTVILYLLCWIKTKNLNSWLSNAGVSKVSWKQVSTEFGERNRKLFLLFIWNFLQCLNEPNCCGLLLKLQVSHN